jgi:hypothetical protein
MIGRPRSITVISWIFIVFGGISFIASLLPWLGPALPQRIAEQPFDYLLIPGIRILAALCGVFMLYGFNWARWLLVIWIVYHVILGALHSWLQLIVHGMLSAVILYFVLRPQASAYFLDASTRDRAGHS